MKNRYNDPKYQDVIQKLKVEMEQLQKEVGDAPA
jgi:hypothetical protein